MSKPIDQEREVFAREDRYIVIKRKDLSLLSPVDADLVQSYLQHIGAMLDYSGAPRRECLVIESDWPEYPIAWGMIEQRMTGQQPAGGAVPEGLADRLEALIPDGDGYNSEYANTLAEAVEFLRSTAAAPHPVSGEQKAEILKLPGKREAKHGGSSEFNNGYNAAIYEVQYLNPSAKCI